MAVVFDAKTLGQGAGVSSITFTHTPSGIPSAVGIACYGYDGASPGNWTCTYGGVTAPAAATQVHDGGPDTCVIFGLANPPSGAQTVVVTGSSGSCYPGATVMTVTGSDTTTCFSAALGAVASPLAGNAGPLSVTITGGSASDLVLFVGGTDGSGASISAGGGGTNTNVLTAPQANSGASTIWFAMSYAAGGASVTGTYTPSVSTPWSMFGASFKTAVGVQFDALGVGANGSGITSISWTHTPKRTPTAVGVWVEGFINPGPLATTYGGTAMSAGTMYGVTAGSAAQSFGLANPASGAQTVVVTITSGNGYISGNSITVTGSDTTTCFSNRSGFTQAGNVTPNSTATVTSAVGELVVDVTGGFQATGIPTSPGAAQTSRYTDFWNSNLNLGISTQPGVAGTATATWQLVAGGGQNWTVAIDSFLAAAVVTTTPSASPLLQTRPAPGLGPRSRHTALLNAALPTPAAVVTVTGGTLPIMGVG